MITIVDSGIANVGSVKNMLRRAGFECKVSKDPDEIRVADRLILPGVGAFEKGMENLEAIGFKEALDEAVLQRGVPILGICLGMHLMTKGSEEGTKAGLGWVNARAVRFNFEDHETDTQKVPHMGWNVTTPVECRDLFAGTGGELRFYYVHSYHILCEDDDLPLATCTYGYDFCAAFNRDNIFGVQFHPEKSHQFGMALLRNFAEYKP